MGRYIASAFAATLMAWFLVPTAAQAGPVVHVGVSLGLPAIVAPAPPVVVVRPACPGPGHVWVEGTFRRDLIGRTIWVPGRWERVTPARTVVVRRAPVATRTVVVHRY